jgi:hypothetical protein
VTDSELLRAYNYAEFNRQGVERWLRFDESPPLGDPIPDFSLQELDGGTTQLRKVCAAHAYTVIEFGSFT